MTATETPHIDINDRGRAVIHGANTKVIMLAQFKIASNSTPEELAEQYEHLSLAQIYAALAYYDDHEDEFDAQMEEDDRYVEEMRVRATGQVTRQRLLEKLERLRAAGEAPRIG